MVLGGFQKVKQDIVHKQSIVAGSSPPMGRWADGIRDRNIGSLGYFPADFHPQFSCHVGDRKVYDVNAHVHHCNL